MLYWFIKKNDQKARHFSVLEIPIHCDYLFGLLQAEVFFPLGMVVCASPAVREDQYIVLHRYRDIKNKKQFSKSCEILYIDFILFILF